MTPLTLAWRNLVARPTRALLLAILVALAVTTALTLLLLSRSIERSVAQGADERGADLSVLQKDAPDILSGYLSQSLGPAIAATPGVAGVTGELAMFAPLDDGRQSIVFGWSADGHFWRRLPIAQGRRPTAADVRPAVLGARVAGALRKKVGDAIEVFGEDFKIVAISGAQAAFNRSVVILRLEDLQEIAIRRGQVTAFHVAVDPRVGADAVARAIESLGRVSAARTSELLAGDRNFAVLRAVSRAVSIIALLMGVTSLFGALTLAVHERRRDIGTLMAIGWSDARIRAAIVGEGALVGVLGGLLAVPATLAAATLFRNLPGVGEFLDFESSPVLFVAAVAAAAGLCAAGAFQPAVAATRRTPSECLKSA